MAMLNSQRVIFQKGTCNFPSSLKIVHNYVMNMVFPMIPALYNFHVFLFSGNRGIYQDFMDKLMKISQRMTADLRAWSGMTYSMTYP